eukprot:comp20650_c0_seq1/m.42170 comp20650_c0_seq1/g.42170  ORF comp20650_c0_seq1/g.42170 comp20650_c0_seq1/m.42170 type:complete len:304 (+) comp20650_c0_seq1:168-1079(+)
MDVDTLVVWRIEQIGLCGHPAVQRNTRQLLAREILGNLDAVDQHLLDAQAIARREHRAARMQLGSLLVGGNKVELALDSGLAGLFDKLCEIVANALDGALFVVFGNAAVARQIKVFLAEALHRILVVLAPVARRGLGHHARPCEELAHGVPRHTHGIVARLARQRSLCCRALLVEAFCKPRINDHLGRRDAHQQRVRLRIVVQVAALGEKLGQGLGAIKAKDLLVLLKGAAGANAQCAAVVHQIPAPQCVAGNVVLECDFGVEQIDNGHQRNSMPAAEGLRMVADRAREPREGHCVCLGEIVL